MAKDYSQYVEHPRYGRSPRFTGLDANPDEPGVYLHWNTRPPQDSPFSTEKPDYEAGLIGGTAIVADVSRHVRSMGIPTHYYDVDRKCRDCRKRFIFFAEQQRHWYEELKFDLSSGCVRCWTCRQHRKMLANKKQRYAQLLHQAERSDDETYDLAECCVTLIEQGWFNLRKITTVQMLFNRLSEDECADPRWKELQARVRAIEAKRE